jgi:uncharacterized tellurite resistance protein B-like protein
MSILDLLRGSGKQPPAPAGATDTVRKIAAQLEALPRDRARYVAAFAYLLGRVAHADLEITSEETHRMVEIVEEYGKLPEEQAVLVVEIAKAQNRLLGHTENFLVAREFREVASRDQSLELLDCLFAVAAADGSISGEEEQQVNLIAGELGLTRQEMVRARSRWNELRSVLKDL